MEISFSLIDILEALIPWNKSGKFSSQNYTWYSIIRNKKWKRIRSVLENLYIFTLNPNRFWPFIDFTLFDPKNSTRYQFHHYWECCEYPLKGFQLFFFFLFISDNSPLEPDNRVETYLVSSKHSISPYRINEKLFTFSSFQRDENAFQKTLKLTCVTCLNTKSSISRHRVTGFKSTRYSKILPSVWSLILKKKRKYQFLKPWLCIWGLLEWLSRESWIKNKVWHQDRQQHNENSES